MPLLVSDGVKFLAAEARQKENAYGKEKRNRAGGN
jgi:hypothetical protein